MCPTVCPMPGTGVLRRPWLGLAVLGLLCLPVAASADPYLGPRGFDAYRSRDGFQYPTRTFSSPSSFDQGYQELDAPGADPRQGQYYSNGDDLEAVPAPPRRRNRGYRSRRNDGYEAPYRGQQQRFYRGNSSIDDGELPRSYSPRGEDRGYARQAPEPEFLPAPPPEYGPATPAPRYAPTQRRSDPDTAAVIQNLISRRYQDPSVVRFIAGLPSDRGLALYGEVLQLIQARHLQPPTPGVLFQRGANNLLVALEVPEFVQANRLMVHPQQMAQFRTAVSQAVRQSRITRAQDAVAMAQWVMQTGQQTIGLPPSTVIVELTYGAVESLDQFSAFVMPEAERAMIRQLGMQVDASTKVTTPTKTAARGQASVVGTRMIDPNYGIGYLKLTTFTQTSAAEMRRAVLTLHQQGLRSLVLDLRGDPGGLLTAAIEVCNEFLPSGTIVSTRGRTREDNLTERANGEQAFKVPLVVLIDENSASASEIFAAAIQENGRGVVVGRRSYGKGTVQTLFPLKSVGAGLRLTTAKFYSPRGREMAGAGVEPDVAVNSSSNSSGDRDLQTAVQVAVQQLGGGRAIGSLSRPGRIPMRVPAYDW